MPDPLYDNSSTPDYSDADTFSSKSSSSSNSLNKNDNSLSETQNMINKINKERRRSMNTTPI
jgi:hypothetical protein